MSGRQDKFGTNKGRKGSQSTSNRIADAGSKLDRRRGAPGVPRVVDRQIGRGSKSDSNQRNLLDNRAWMLDLMAWARYDRVAPKIHLNVLSPRMPALVLPQVHEPDQSEWIVALDLADALRKLKSRSRAFSQIAGRFSSLVLAARESSVALRIEIWDLDLSGAIREPDSWLQDTARQLAKYLEAEVVIIERSELRQRLAKAAMAPEPLRMRNPMAAALWWKASSIVSDAGEGD
ncbi:MAG TPA: hypothetical protein DCQ06_04050 [Myxococcales bacterium]|nr:hypothetical protein [Myxococcales bacterium]